MKGLVPETWLALTNANVEHQVDIKVYEHRTMGNKSTDYAATNWHGKYELKEGSPVVGRLAVYPVIVRCRLQNSRSFISATNQ